jgi:hypothetical protein
VHHARLGAARPRRRPAPNRPRPAGYLYDPTGHRYGYLEVDETDIGRVIGRLSDTEFALITRAGHPGYNPILPGDLVTQSYLVLARDRLYFVDLDGEYGDGTEFALPIGFSGSIRAKAISPASLAERLGIQLVNADHN